MNILNRDLNLLLTFHLLYQERNASRAAQLLNVSQPALSHKLNKLRHEWGDPLFVKTARGLTPTPKANQLAEQIAQLLPTLERFYASHSEPDFLQREDEIRIALPESVEVDVLPPLFRRVRERAPNVRLLTLQSRGEVLYEKLRQGSCDIAVCRDVNQIQEGYVQQTLGEEPYVALVSSANSLVKPSLTLERYLACDHLVITPDGGLLSDVDDALKALNMARHSVIGLSNNQARNQILLENPTTLVTTTARQARLALGHYPNLLEIHPLPFNVPPIALYLVWHQRTDEDPLRRWLREQLLLCFQAR